MCWQLDWPALHLASHSSCRRSATASGDATHPYPICAVEERILHDLALPPSFPVLLPPLRTAHVPVCRLLTYPPPSFFLPMPLAQADRGRVPGHWSLPPYALTPSLLPAATPLYT